MAGACANALPKTSTNAICIEKDNKPHTPAPQALIMSIGPCLVNGIAAEYDNDSMIQKINGSGRNLLTSATHPFVSF